MFRRMVAHSAEREIYWKNIVTSVVQMAACSKDCICKDAKECSEKKVILQIGMEGALQFYRGMY